MDNLKGEIIPRDDGTFSVKCGGKTVDGFKTIIEAGEELDKMLFGEVKQCNTR